MKAPRMPGLLVAALIACCALPAAVAAPGTTVSIAFTPSDADFPNPERGYYVPVKDGEMSARTLEAFARKYDTRLFYYPADLGPYRATRLPADYLDALARRFAAVRAAGAKLVLRFVYDDTAVGRDAPLTIVRQHLAQLHPVLAANVDVIAYLQAGLIGAWGEGHTSTNDLASPASKAAIRDAWLDAAPESLSIQFQPADVRAWGGPPRIAAKNDCLLANDTDAHHFPGGLHDPLRRYLQAVNEHAPYGGETCRSPGRPEQARMGCDAILAEGAAYKLAYLNLSFYRAFHESWRAGGCAQQVAISLGYRFQLDGVAHAAGVARGGTLRVEVDLRNVGWARIFSARKLVATLRDPATGRSVAASAGDLRSLAPSASRSSRIAAELRVDAPPGRYELFLSAPDVHASTHDDPRFSVRFANADDPRRGQAWIGSRGELKTGTSVTVR